jgi:small-conductance mechanosensitive channel
MASEPASPFSLQQLQSLRTRLLEGLDAARAEAFTFDIVLQLGAIAFASVLGLVLGPLLVRLFKRIFAAPKLQPLRDAGARVGASIAGMSLIVMVLVAARIGFEQAGGSVFLLNLAVSLAVAWVIIRVATAFIAEPFWARLIANIVWVIAALNIVGWLSPFSAFLNGIGMDVGEGGRLSLLTVLRAVFILAILYWLATRVSRLLSTRVTKIPNLTPSARLLLTKTVQIGLITLAVVLGLNISGVDLAALAIFSGAVGLGIGFGLQKIFANLISGLILLMDRSIKPGDVITLEDTYGHVNALGMRFASVITRDGMEHIIPNEDFITTKVINWSYSDRAVRVKKEIGVAYGTDVPRAMELIVEAANTVTRVLEAPATRCLLRSFDESQITLEVRFWISDPEGGVNNVSSDVLVAIWKSFAENDVQFPFPQRDIHLKSEETIRVRLEGRDSPESSSPKS